MNQENNLASPTVRVNCNITGIAAEALLDLKRKGIIQNNREAVVQALLALEEKVTKSGLEKTKLRTLTQQSMFLPLWTEIGGTLNGTEATDTDLTAHFTCTVEKHYAITIQNSPETEQLQQQLKKLTGQKIALIRTDNPKKPYAVKAISKHNEPQDMTYIEATGSIRNYTSNRSVRCTFCGVD